MLHRGVILIFPKGYNTIIIPGGTSGDPSIEGVQIKNGMAHSSLRSCRAKRGIRSPSCTNSKSN